MEKTNKEKNNTNKYILQTIGIVSVSAITIVIMILCIRGCDSSDKDTVSTEKSASEDTTTDKLTSEQKTTDEEDMTEETTKTAIDSKTDGKETEDETTDTEETTKSQQVVQKITTSGQTTGGNTQVVQNTTTSRPTTTQKQTTTKKQETTTKQQTTTAAPRGRNGVILEELSFVRWNEVIPVPKTKTELIKQQDNPDARGYGIVYNHPAVTQENIFNNEIRFSHTTESELISIYGNPLTSYTTENGKFIVYRYGDYANGIEKEIIYIRFGFANVLGMNLGSAAIGNVDDLGLAKFLN